jgi:hypothetical protein
MSVNGIGSSNMMGPRMSTNLTVDRQSAKVSFGERVQAGMNNAAGAVAGGLGTVAGMVPGGSVVSAAVSTLSGVNSAGAGSQYQGAAGLGAMASGVTGVPTLNTTVGSPGGMVAGGGAGTGSSTAGGIGLAAGAMGSAGGPTGGVGNAVASDPTLNAMFSEQKKLLGLQAAIGAEANSFQAISNVMKTRHDSAKNAVSNVR